MLPTSAMWVRLIRAPGIFPSSVLVGVLSLLVDRAPGFTVIACWYLAGTEGISSLSDDGILLLDGDRMEDVPFEEDPSFSDPTKEPSFDPLKELCVKHLPSPSGVLASGMTFRASRGLNPHGA